MFEALTSESLERLGFVVLLVPPTGVCETNLGPVTPAEPSLPEFRRLPGFTPLTLVLFFVDVQFCVTMLPNHPVLTLVPVDPEEPG